MRLSKPALAGSADVWSVTSFGELRRDAIACDRERLLQPDQWPPLPCVTRPLADKKRAVIPTSDCTRAYPDLIRNRALRRCTVHNADGFGRSDARAALSLS